MPDVAHHPGEPAGRARDAQQRGPRIGLAARADADDAADVLLGVPGRPWQQGGHICRLQGLHVRRRQLEAEVDELHGPAGSGCRVDEVRHLVGAERDREVGDDVRSVDLAGVDVDTGRHVDRHHRDAVERATSAAAASGRSPALPPMPTIPSTTTSGAGPSSVSTSRPPAASRAASPASWWLAPSSQHVDGHPAAAQPRSGVQRVPAVVPGPDQQQHPPPVATAEEVEHGVGEAGGRALHQGTVGQVLHQGRLGSTHLGDGVGETHAGKNQFFGIRNTWPGKIRSGFSMLFSLAISW